MADVSQIRVPAERFDAPLDPADLFARPAPLELEVGCGKGGFLLDQARTHPERNYLGIEWANKYAGFAADRMARWGLANVRIVRTDARQVFLRALPGQCLDALHVYHPDPWPKRRHARRRLIQADFVAAAVRTLRPGARWSVQTDHPAYFEQIHALLTAHPQLETADYGDGSAGTNFEIKYRKEGRRIYRLAVRKRIG